MDRREIPTLVGRERARPAWNGTIRGVAHKVIGLLRELALVLERRTFVRRRQRENVLPRELFRHGGRTSHYLSPRFVYPRVGIDVLVVEDDRPLCELLTRAIRRNDLATDVAGDVAEVKRLLARNRYKVVVLDLMLPDGSGFDVVDFMKAERLTPSIVVVTAADGSLLVRLDRAAVKTVMLKPLDVEQLASYVHTLTLDRARDLV